MEILSPSSRLSLEDISGYYISISSGLERLNSKYSSSKNLESNEKEELRTLMHNISLLAQSDVVLSQYKSDNSGPYTDKLLVKILLLEERLGNLYEKVSYK